jgi:uncharacterized membrane protein YphA (DoxX/SURF4 family)
VQSLLLAFHPRAIQSFAQYGYPDWIRLLLAWSEIAAAILFLLPRTFWIGAWLLLLVLSAAAGLHIVLGENPLLPFVYMLATALVMVYRRPRRGSMAPRAE